MAIHKQATHNEHSAMHMCVKCDDDFDTVDELHEHECVASMKIESPDDIESSLSSVNQQRPAMTRGPYKKTGTYNNRRIFLCDLCKNGYKTEERLLRHKYLAHDVDARAPSARSAGELFYKHLAASGQLAQLKTGHMRPAPQSTASAAIECTSCTAVFGSHHALDIHRHRVHEDVERAAFHIVKRPQRSLKRNNQLKQAMTARHRPQIVRTLATDEAESSFDDVPSSSSRIMIAKSSSSPPMLTSMEVCPACMGVKCEPDCPVERSCTARDLHS
jgi:hypothetical protein